MYTSNNYSMKGFTLLELIVTITIVALISSVAAVSYTNVQRSSRDTRRKADLKSIQTALEFFRQRNSRYPSTGGVRWGTCSAFGSHDDTGPDGYVPDLAPEFIPVLPRDPREAIANGTVSAGCNATDGTCYVYHSDGVEYKLMAHCTNEVEVEPNDPFFDPIRPGWTLQVSSSTTSRDW